MNPAFRCDVTLRTISSTPFHAHPVPVPDKSVHDTPHSAQSTPVHPDLVAGSQALNPTTGRSCEGRVETAMHPERSDRNLFADTPFQGSRTGHQHVATRRLPA